MKYKNNLLLQQILFLVMIIFIAVAFVSKLSFFIGSILGAITLSIILQKPYKYLTERLRWKGALAASAIMVVIVLIISLILWLLFNQVLTRVSNIDFNQINSGVNYIREKSMEIFGYNIIPNDLVQQIGSILGNVVSSIFNVTYSVVANLVMMFFLLYFMLTSTNNYTQIILDFLPLSNENKILLKKETIDMIYANTVGIPLMMIVQGIFAYVGYLIFGLSDSFFWGILTGLFSIFPIVGTAVIWVPMVIYLFTTGEVVNGIGLLLYGTLVITNVDNLFRFILMKKIADVHPVITVLGVIIGVPMFGFWGIIFGPSLLSIFLLLLKTYRKEYLLNEDKPEIITDFRNIPNNEEHES